MRVLSNAGSFHNYLLAQEDMNQLHHPAVVISSSPNHGQQVLRQSASRVVSFSSQYGDEESAFAYTAQNLAGETRIYPRYGDCSHAAVFRTFDRWWTEKSLLWFDEEFNGAVKANDLTEDFIHLSYTTPVYLKAVEIYETFNVGHVVRVFAGYAPSPDEPVQQWTLLWSGRPDTSLPNSARAFVPPLQLQKLDGQPVNAIRLEMCSIGAEYYPELDAVYIHGYSIPNSVEKSRLCDPPEVDTNSSRSLLSPHSVKSLSSTTIEDPCDLDYNISSGSKSCSAVTTPNKATSVSGNAWSLWSVQQALEDMQKLSSKMVPNSGSHSYNLDTLPHELIHEIVSWLPRYDRTRTLIRLSLVCKRLYSALRDPAMHDVVDLKPCWYKVDNARLQYLSEISYDIQRLRASWLPLSVDLAPFLEAIKSNRLQTLLLSCCQQVTDDVLENLCQSQQQLQTLDLGGCRQVSSPGFFCLESLVNLRRLSLYRTLIGEPVLVGILQKLPRLEALDIGSLSKVSNMDAVLRCISLACPELKALDCWRGKSVTHFGLRELAAGCKKLEELDLGWCGDVRSSTSIFRQLANSLPLRRLLLTANRTICDADLEFFAVRLAETLEHLDILGCRDVTSTGVITLLDCCRRLVFLDVSFCASLDFEEVASLRRTFPNCSIKKSYQP